MSWDNAGSGGGGWGGDYGNGGAAAAAADYGHSGGNGASEYVHYGTEVNHFGCGEAANHFRSDGEDASGFGESGAVGAGGRGGCFNCGEEGYDSSAFLFHHGTFH